MIGFRDIHAHFIYGLDDGAQTSDSMKVMLKTACADGVTTLYATPHVEPGIRAFDRDRFRQRFNEARRWCEMMDYNIRLLEGAENLYTPAITPFAKDRRLITLGETDFVLMEFVPDVSLEEIESALKLMERCDYKPILAHIERYESLYSGNNALKLKEKYDVCYQMNCSTVIDGRGFWRNLCIGRWLKMKLVDFIASDAHDTKKRVSRMKKAYGVICEKYGDAYAKYLMEDT